MEDELQTLELYDLSYSDLCLISSDPSPSPEELERLQCVSRSVMEALGPTGPGLLSVTGVPNDADLRRSLWLARSLALLDPRRRSIVLREQVLGSDVPLTNPERSVSSFAVKLRYGLDSDSKQDFGTGRDVDDEYRNLGADLKELRFWMMDIGHRLARVCDNAIGGGELEQSLLESSEAKGRLIHYHSELDRRVLQDQARTTKRGHFGKNRSKEKRFGTDGEDDFDLWQQWHYDYGIFTILTTPLFLVQQVNEDQCEECVYPGGDTLLQVFDPTRRRVFMVRASKESFIVQVGESAEVISKGKLRATLHSVSRPLGKLVNLSRETFVVFLQPAWDKVLCESEYPPEHSDLEEQSVEGVEKIVPRLSLRLKGGMTFAEFARETTKQYYGGGGLQSNR